MNNKKTIKHTIKHCLETLPPNLSSAKQDIEKCLQTSLQNVLAKLNLVTREEFDAQVNVLQRTRQKLETLKKKISNQKSNANANSDNNPKEP